MASTGLIATTFQNPYYDHFLVHGLQSGGGCIPNKKFVSLWDISPATNPAEVFDLRAILARAVYQRNTLFFIASIACVGAAIVSAASTTTANNTFVRNRVIPHRVVDGRLVTHEHASLSGAVVNVTSRAEALAKAQAPLNQLFDFAPDDSSEWVFVAEQWNNTWTGNCTFSMHPAVDLVVYPTNSSNFQDEVPLLGSYLPQWATIDPTRQGTAYSGFYTGAGVVNDSGAWRDLLVINISFANFLAHNVGRYSTSSDGFVQSSLKSDVYVVECILTNSAPGIEDQAYADSVAAPVVQMRISVLLITVGGFIAALTTATVSVLTEPRDSLGRRIALPSSPLDWIVQAAREHEQGIAGGSYFWHVNRCGWPVEGSNYVVTSFAE
ncbi:hypothetical protein BD410DRAFT_902659 [Rickenella mellea]|uniref:Transmembrane protein n=1 Tax=Rickenella mellea TaxID=50990 RepID=A0A4Y7PIU2_9AGAM|nr:hypothetical protein BD410DRAFT_902659 [Rickenella mellea]